MPLAPDVRQPGDHPTALEQVVNRAARPPLAWPFILAGLIAIAAQAPLLAEAAARLDPLRQYRFSLLLLAAAMLAAVRAPRPGAPARMGRFGWLIWGTAAVLTACAIVFRSSSVGAVAFLVTLLAAVDSALGPTARGAFLPAWLCLWLMVPLPVARQVTLVDALQAGAVQEASMALDLAGVRHRVTDGAIETPGRTFPLHSSGDVLFVSLGMVALATAALRRGPLWSGALLGATVFWSFCSEVLSIAIPVYASQGERTAFAVLPHLWADAVAIVFVLALAHSTDRGLFWLMPHGGPHTWQVIRGLLGDDAVVGLAPDAAKGPGRRPAMVRQGLIVAAVFAFVALLWFLPPLGSADRERPSSESGSGRAE